MKAMGIVFSNIYDNTMGILTENRTLASMPFGGRYRQIDFTLSNMTNAGIRHIGIITKYNYRSLMNHVGAGQEWNLNLKDSGLVFLPPYASGHDGVYRGKLEALHTALPFLDEAEEDYVVLSDSRVICAIELHNVLKAHEQSGCDVTIVTTSNRANDERKLSVAVMANADNEVTDFAVDYCAPKGYYAGMGMFIMKRELLIDAIRDTVSRGRYHLERDFLLANFQAKKLRLHMHLFEHVVLFNDSPTSFFHNNQALLHKKVRDELFHTNVPIYTKVRDEVPTYYGVNAAVENCIIADGCKIDGIAQNSILFREVCVEQGAMVRNCVIMQSAIVSAHTQLEYVILDKDVTILPGTVLKGSPEHPMTISKGEVI